LSQVGISVVRIWLMGDGANYDGDVTFGFSPDRGYFWDFEPPDRLDRSFHEDFEKLLSIFEAAKMMIIPVLLDFSFFDDPRADSTFAGGSVRVPHPGTARTNGDYFQGRRSIVTNRVHRDKFLKGTLEPLLQVAAAHRGIIEAFEVINEPYWCVARITGNLFGRRIDTDVFVSFLSECIKAVKAQKLPVTVGHRYFGDITGTFEGISVDKPQFHYYASAAPYDRLPSVRSAPIKPLLGEFGSVVPAEMAEFNKRLREAREEKVAADLRKQIANLERTNNPWPGLSGADQVLEHVLPVRLITLERLGYELALLWPSAIETPADTMKLNDRKLESLGAWSATKRAVAPR
jgi:hypothetical protein